MMAKRKAAFALVLLLVLSGVHAQTYAGADIESLRTAITLFADGRYAEALPILQAVTTYGADNLRPEGHYWLAMSKIALNELTDALKLIDSFLQVYPLHSKSGDMMYQRGRVAFMLSDYESAIKNFSSFINSSPGSDNLANAIFWSAEAAYALGRMVEAENLYRSLVENFPESVKLEAAQYRLNLVQFKYREDELLTLLKWSHEESLRVIEEFQRREKAYEQAIMAYQKQYGGSQPAISTSTEADKEIARLRIMLDDLQLKLDEKDLKIAKLEMALAGDGEKEPITQSATTLAETGTETVLEKEPEAVTGTPADRMSQSELLEIRARALRLLQSYTDENDGNPGVGQ